MRVTVFTSNQLRHIALLDGLVAAGHTVQAVIEPKTSLLPERGPLAVYWGLVRAAEAKVFGDYPVITVPCVVLRPGELSRAVLPFDWTVNTSRFVVFSSSYITGRLAEFLVANDALNLHVGIAPEMRGSAPNFWAEFNRRPDLVGAQVQRLSKGLDAGEILTEVRPPLGGDPFLRGMEACRLGIEAMIRQVEMPIDTWTPMRANDRSLQVAYTRHDDFTEQVVEHYLRRFDNDNKGE